MNRYRTVDFPAGLHDAVSTDSLFGHLALQFSAHPENLATEALNYVLNRTPSAREAIIKLSTQSGATLPDDLRFRTQVASDDQAIPDLVGLDAGGQQRLIIEAKFWAGLTDRQPVDYLDRLTQPGGILLFVAPGLRLPSLWPELLRRCKEAGRTIEASPQSSETLRLARVDSQRSLGLMSWRALVQVMLVKVSGAGETRAVEDLTQLQGLCDRMDDDAFLPVQSEELSVASPARVVQFMELVDVLAARSLEHWCSGEGLKTASSQGIYGRYLRLRHSRVGVFIHVDLRKWAHLLPTPFWLRIANPDWKPPTVARAALAALEHELPSRLLQDRTAPLYVSVPLHPPLGVERDLVLEKLMQQLRSVYEILDAIPPPAPGVGSAVAAQPGEVPDGVQLSAEALPLSS